MSITNTETAFDTLAPRRQRSGFAMASTAFGAIFLRDLQVAWRELIATIMQVLLQPLFLLFIFGKVLPGIGFTSANFGSIFLPGVIAFTIFATAFQGTALPLILDLGFERQIDDRILSPMPVQLVAIEKIIFAALRGLIAGAVIFPLAWWILGTGYQVRTDLIPQLIGLMVLIALASAAFGLTLGASISPEHIGLMFALIFTPVLFLGCTYYPWSLLDSLKWFQIVTLFNPLTYASEGMRYVMVPTIHGYTLPTLNPGWVLLGLGVTLVLFTYLGMKAFHGKVVS
jgi:ABC-2 type transport system permease protein